MLHSHKDIRFIIIDYGVTHKTVYKHSISNNNVLVPVHLKLDLCDKNNVFFNLQINLK